MRALLELVLSPFDALLAALPLQAARWLTVGFLLASALAALFLPRDYVLLGAPDQRWFRDLRLWAVVAMVPYVLIYALF